MQDYIAGTVMPSTTESLVPRSTITKRDAPYGVWILIVPHEIESLK